MLKTNLLDFCITESSSDVLDVMSIRTLYDRFTVDISFTRNSYRLYGAIGQVGNEA